MIISFASDDPDHIILSRDVFLYYVYDVQEATILYIDDPRDEQNDIELGRGYSYFTFPPFVFLFMHVHYCCIIFTRVVILVYFQNDATRES